MPFYLIYATQKAPPGSLERAVFFHNGAQKDVMAYAQQIIGPSRKVPYQVEVLAENRFNQPTPLCHQMRFVANARANLSPEPGMGGANIPTDLNPVRPTDETEPQITQSNLGEEYAAVPDELRGEL